MKHDPFPVLRKYMFFVDETNVVYILYSKRVLDSNFVLDDQG
jgi:hypothetical protein